MLRDSAHGDRVPLLSLLQTRPLQLQAAHLSFQEYYAARAVVEGAVLPTPPWALPPWWANAVRLGAEMGVEFGRGLLRAAGGKLYGRAARVAMGGHRPTAAAAPVPRCWRDVLRPPHVRESARARACTANWSRPRARTAACCEPARRVFAPASRAPRHLRRLRPVPADGEARSASVGRLKLGGREIAPETTAALVAFCSFMLPNRLRVVV